MPQNFLMIVDITGVAGLSCAIYVILRYSYYFQATFSFQGCSVKKKLMCNILNVVPKRFTDFYWSLQHEKFDCESKIRMKCANLSEK